ncbi:MAG: hypothetical protein HC780_28530 [Leptolyngbyaceae cyanobacterium CSU_1_3]|nr:hypothetical protein [Leptolyngbyaceae cyanobacterium CSU_1_3]
MVTGDSNKKDDWYPRLYQSDRWEQKQSFHVCELCKLDACCDPNQKIWVRPSRFDFEFLDSTARRFEIYYDENGRRPRRTRPFYLEDLDRFDTLWKILKKLETSQRHQVIYAIEATRETWYGMEQDTADKQNRVEQDEVFRQFVADTLANAAWSKDQPWKSIPQDQQKQLIDAGVRGELADLADLYMEILKQR